MNGWQTSRNLSPRSSRLSQSAISVVALWVVLVDITTVITVSTGHSLFAFGGADGRLPLTFLPQINQAALHTGTTGTLADADLGLRLLSAAPSLANAVIAVLAAFFLILILDNIATGHSFERPVLRLWKYLAIALLVGGGVQSILVFGAWAYLTIGITHTNSDRIELLGGDYQVLSTHLPDLPIALLLGGLISLALTLAFRAGARLEQEVDGIV